MRAPDPISPGFLDGQILIAMPGMRDTRFQKSLVYLCAHSATGAMGLILNKCADSLKLKDLFSKLDLPCSTVLAGRPVHYGGPVEPARGFVLHSSDYHADQATMKVDAHTSMTATVEILHAMAMAKGPDRAVIALGYAGWGAGQLESELQQNGWLACPPDPELLFGQNDAAKWDRALAKLGIHPMSLSAMGGRA